MLDMSWGEILVIGAVALIVIGPKELPRALRTLGQMTTKVRRMAGEFQSQFSDAMREAELDDVRKQLGDLNQSVAAATAPSFNPIQSIRDEIKTSIETPLTTPTPAGTVAGGVGEAASPAPVEPSISLPVPPVADSAHGFGDIGDRESNRRVGVFPTPEPVAAPSLAEPALHAETKA